LASSFFLSYCPRSRPLAGNKNPQKPVVFSPVLAFPFLFPCTPDSELGIQVKFEFLPLFKLTG